MSRSAVFLPVATLPALCASCAAFHSPISGGAIRSFRSDSLPVSSVVQGFGFEPRLKRVPPACLKAAAATDSREEERTRVLLVTKIVQQLRPAPRSEFRLDPLDGVSNYVRRGCRIESDLLDLAFSLSAEAQHKREERNPDESLG